MRLLVGEIVSGTLAVGDKLPREADLAEQHQVSRGVARECIRGLEERGLVSVRHGIGATVTPPGQWDIFDSDVLVALLQGDAGDRVLREYLECRRILEVEAAGLAAERATRADLDTLAEAFESMTEAARRARSNPAAETLYHEADIVFHRAVVFAAENRALARITEPLHRTLTASLRRSARPEIRLERGLPEHERILDAIVARDPEAARRAMGDHLASVEVALKAAGRPPRRARPRRTRRPTAGAAAR
jgi:GntR family transcriptional repressor for pyruvate dehydrogenase complex